MTSTTSSSSRTDDNSGIRVFSGVKELDQSPFDRPLHLAVGMFDGVHIGHQSVIRKAIEAADKEAAHCSGVLTFDPHPSRVLYPEKATALLTPLQPRVARMLDIGVDRVFVQTFTSAYSRREAQDFVPSLKQRFPGLLSIHVGENFRFGAGRSGDVDTLATSAGPLGVQVYPHPRTDFAGEPVSSSRIRRALTEGRIGEANAMMGSPYRVRGTVAPGRGLGRGMGFPTLNVPWDPEAKPRFGVYRVRLRQTETAEWLAGIANYGVRPTVGDTGGPLLEVHLLETGAASPADMVEVEIELLDFIRPEQSFSSMEALRVQIGNDVKQVRRALNP